jgi:hypothetical protein
MMLECESCCYFSDEEQCLVRKVMNDSRREQGCESFIDSEFKPEYSGCCGIYNMPHASSTNNTTDDE